MRTLFLILSLLNLSNGLLNWKSVSKLRETLSSVKSRLDVDRLLEIRRKFNRYVEAPELNSLQRTLLTEGLKAINSLNSTNTALSDTIENINEREGMTELLYQGDIVPTEDLLNALIDNGRPKRQATTRNHLKWPDNRFYFSFRSDQRNNVMKDIARQAAKLWHNNTCINMIEDDTAPERVEIFEGRGCYSYIGNIHRVQELSLGYGCHHLGTAAHELAHALGLHHVQSRYDRNDYVTINIGNVPAHQLKTDFSQETRETSNNHGVPYDYGSLMHYSVNAFAIDRSMPTIIPFNKNYVDTMGSPFVSFYDLLLMNKHYNCLEKCKSGSSAKCRMGGFPNPRDCSVCICPDGYTGRLCGKKPTGCGEILKAKDEMQTLEFTFGKENDLLQNYEKCFFWIKAPKGRKVEIKISDIFSQWVSDGCNPGGMEIKVQKDQRLTGYRFCKHSNAGKVFLSEVSKIPIIFYRERGVVLAKLEYRLA